MNTKFQGFFLYPIFFIFTCITFISLMSGLFPQDNLPFRFNLSSLALSLISILSPLTTGTKHQFYLHLIIIFVNDYLILLSLLTYHQFYLCLHHHLHHWCLDYQISLFQIKIGHSELTLLHCHSGCICWLCHFSVEWKHKNRKLSVS